MIVNILNKSHVCVNGDQTPYELLYGKPHTVKHFKVFGSKCFIKKTNEKLGKFEPRADEGIFLGYSYRIKGYKCYNKRFPKIVECIDVVIDEACINLEQVTLAKEDDNDEDGELFPLSNQNDIEEETNEGSEEDTSDRENAPSRYVQKNHPESQILGEKGSGVQKIRTLAGTYIYLALLSSIEPQNVSEARRDECWVKVMDD